MTAEDARIAALAAEQFHEHGITATGVDALSRAAGISKRTLYERFGSKDGLIVAAYEASTCRCSRCSLRRSRPRRTIRAHSSRRSSRSSSRSSGCRTSAAARSRTRPPSSPIRDHPAHRVVRRHKERIRRWLRAARRPRVPAIPEQLSRQLMLVFAGVQSQALLERSARPARDARVLARALIDAAVEPRRPSRVTSR